MYYRSDYIAYQNCYHFTAVTKYRKCVFNEQIRTKLAQLLIDKSENIGLKVLAVAVAVNHFHIIVSGEGRLDWISQNILGYSSRLIRSEFPVLKKLHKNQLWGGKACTNIRNLEHLNNAIAYIDRHDPEDSRVK